ncbi:MAG: class I SAM-dependent methyltransferase [Planctomycetes bacterium]|nr:class I SAM-dependent methyltransferase [Planctomycetota bacterium]
MKTRDSGMPMASQWEGYFDPQGIFAVLGLAIPEETLVDIGCGYGTFTMAAARCGWRRVIAIDIDPVSVQTLQARLLGESAGGAEVRQRDVVADGFGLPSSDADAVLLFNILHCEDPLAMLAETRRVLRPGGRVAIIHWRSDIPTPRGPAAAIRPRPENCREWLEKTGFEIALEATSLPPYHFGLVGRRPASAG